MTYEKLVKKVRDHNQGWFLERFKSIDDSPSQDSGSVLIDLDMVLTDSKHSLCGSTKTTDDVKELTGKWLILEGANQRKDCVAVGAIVDRSTRLSNEDLPLVLAMGINYGQGDGYAVKGVPLEDNTQLKGQTTAVMKKLQKVQCIEEYPEEYHLAAANFFPLITKWSWGQLNSIEESILLRQAGFLDPVAYAVSLITALEPDVVIFHGANNAVPGLGWRVVDALHQNQAVSKFVFSDNLAPPQRAVINAVMSAGRMGRHCIPQNFDE